MTSASGRRVLQFQIGHLLLGDSDSDPIDNNGLCVGHRSRCPTTTAGTYTRAGTVTRVATQNTEHLIHDCSLLCVAGTWNSGRTGCNWVSSPQLLRSLRKRGQQSAPHVEHKRRRVTGVVVVVILAISCVKEPLPFHKVLCRQVVVGTGAPSVHFTRAELGQQRVCGRPTSQSSFHASHHFTVAPGSNAVHAHPLTCDNVVAVHEIDGQRGGVELKPRTK